MASNKTYQNFSEGSNSVKYLRSLSITQSCESGKLIIIMVGLPARGKSYIAGKICNFLCWRGHKCKIFNVGHFRRAEMADEPNQTSEFFAGSDQSAVAKRNSLALKLLDIVIHWLADGNGQIAIFDATNTTRSRRKILVDKVSKTGHRFLFVESFCDDKKVIESNLLTKAKRSPDFEGMDIDSALAELKKRLRNYEKVYECITDSEGYGYIKMINLGQKLVCQKLHGFISRLLMVFLLNLNVDKKVILMTRAGNCTSDISFADNSEIPLHKSKESGLSKEGKIFAKRLADFVKIKNLARLQVWTSTIRRAIETTQFLEIDNIKTEDSYLSNPEGQRGHVSIFSTPRLKMVNQGVCFGMQAAVIEQVNPEVYSAWKKDPLVYRFPGGESYSDAVMRAESIVIDLEQNKSPVLIITHISMLRVLFAYFKGIPVEKVVDLDVPQGVVLEFEPTIYGWVEKRHDLMAGVRNTNIDEINKKGLDQIPLEARPFI